MEKFAVLATLKAKPGYEKEVIEFLKSAQPLAINEPETVSWYALQVGPSTFCIFDTFETTDGRMAHIKGPIAAALSSNASAFLAEDPDIKFGDIFAVK